MIKAIAKYCLLLFAVQLHAQLPDYHVQMLVKKAGLVQPNQLEEMMRDNHGFLWLLTPSKAQRFDGKNIISFSFDDRCIGIQQDAEGTIWVAARQNIYRFRNAYEGFESLTENRSGITKYRSLLAGPANKLYLLTTDGIVQWNTAKNKIEPTRIPPFKSTGSFPFLKSFGNWLFYRLNDSTLVRCNVITGTADSVAVAEASYLIPKNADSVWVRQGIGSTALVSFKTKTVSPVTKNQFKEKFTDENFFITGGFAGISGDFFTILDDKGYYSYNSATNRFKKVNLFYNGRPLSGKPLLGANNFFKEANSIAWCTNEEGIIYFNMASGGIGVLRSNIDAGGRQWNNEVRNFAEDDKGNIWFGTANGFCKWDKSNGNIITWNPKFDANNYLNYASVKSMAFSNGKIIVGQSEKGFWIFDPLKQTFIRPHFEADSLQLKFQKEFNRNILKLQNGNFLILSNEEWLIDGESFLIKQLNTSATCKLARKAVEDEQGRIWFLGANGIAVVNKDFKLLYSLDDKILGRWYNALVQIDEETFWVAAKNLYEIKLQPHQQQHPKLKLSVRRMFPEFKTLHFSNLFKDSLQRIWMCHEEGIYRYDPQTNITEKFDQNDNVQNFYAGVSNSFRGSDGTVYFGSMNGINYCKPEKIALQNDSLAVQLLNITINQDDSSFLKNGSIKNLSYLQNAVGFDFVAPYLYNPEKVQYRYRLDGTDTAWVNLGNNSSIRFNSLQPGNYAFHVAASLNGKDWFTMQSPFAFVIDPPFWKTGWFLILLFIIIIASAFLFLKIRIRFIKKREAEKTALQKLKAAGYREQLEIEQIINHFATSMNNVSNIDDVLWDVAKNCISKLNFEDCVIYLKDDERDVLVQKAAWGNKTSGVNDAAGGKEKIVNPIEILPGCGIVGAVAVSGIAEIIQDTSRDERYIIDDMERLSEITVPIMNNGKVLGIIDSEHPQRNFYTERHLQILNTIASLCAGKIDTIHAEQQVREKEMELLRLHKDVATSQLIALRMQMNPHFIFNALNSVQHFILQGNVVEANKYLSKFSKLQREILHCSSQSFITLEKEIEILNSYLQLEQFRFGESFLYQINMTHEIEPDEIKIPPMMLQPFVENAIWHGLMPLQTQRNLSVYFDLHTEDILLATIRDNGIGRSASAKLKQTNGGLKNGFESKGMTMVQQRLHLLQQQYDRPFDAAISDITDVNGLVQGTQVTLKIFIGNTKS